MPFCVGPCVFHACMVQCMVLFTESSRCNIRWNLIKGLNFFSNWLFVSKRLSGVGKGNVTRKRPKLYRFHVSDCFRSLKLGNAVYLPEFLLVQMGFVLDRYQFGTGFLEYQNRKKYDHCCNRMLVRSC